MMSRTTLGWMIGGWTLVSWGGRIAIVLDTGSDPWDRIRIFLAVAVGVVAWAAGVRGRGVRPAFLSYATVTAVVWIRSVITVLSGDASPGFVAVHLVLAAVSLTLAALAVAATRRQLMTGRADSR